LIPNDPYSGRTAPLTSKRCILYIYSTNTGTEYFKHGTYSPFFLLSLQNAVCFIILTYLVPVLFTFYLQGVLKLKKNNSGVKRLITQQLIKFNLSYVMYRRYKIYHFFHKGCETWSLTLSIRTWDQEVCELSPEEDMWVYEGRGKRSLTDIA